MDSETSRNLFFRHAGKKAKATVDRTRPHPLRSFLPIQRGGNAFPMPSFLGLQQRRPEVNSLSNPNYKIALYIRNSDQKQDTEEGTVKNQEQRLREFVTLKNLSGNFGKVMGVYTDRSLSGKNMHRPAVQKLMGDVESGKVNLILMSELSRISRNMRDFLQFWDFLKAHKCGLSSLRENIDTSNAAGEMVLRTIINIAQFEREQTRERIIANNQVRSKRGLSNGGPSPLGYKLIKDRPGYLDIDPPNAKIVKKAFDAFLKVGTLNATASWLNQNGIEMPRRRAVGGHQKKASLFNFDNLHQLLRNKAYKGVKTYWENGKEREAMAVWKGIISPEQFDRVQEILDKNYRRKKPFTAKRWPYTLTGLASCLKCRAAMSGKSAHGRNRKYGYYEHNWANRRGSSLAKDALKCNPHRVPADILEEVVTEQVKELLTSPQMAKGLIEEAHKIYQANRMDGKEISDLKRKITGLEGNEMALTERLAELPAKVSAAPIYKQLENLQEARKKAEEVLLRLEGERARDSQMPSSLASYTAFLKALPGYFEDAHPEQKSEIFKRIIGKIEISTDKVRIHYLVGKKWVERGIDAKNPQTPDFAAVSGSRTLTSGGR